MASAKGARNAAVWGTDKLNESWQQQKDTLGQGYDTLKDMYGQGQATLGNLVSAGQGGLARYQDLSGANGGAALNASLTSTPGYNFAFDQGMQALNRRRAAGGMLNSGNADVDAMRFGQGLATQTLAAERAAQIPLMNFWNQGTTGQAQGQYRLGDLGYQFSKDQNTLMDDRMKNIVGLGVGAFKAGDQAKAQNEANMMAGVKMGVDVLGALAGMPGAGSSLGSFTSLFGGGGGAGMGISMGGATGGLY